MVAEVVRIRLEDSDIERFAVQNVEQGTYVESALTLKIFFVVQLFVSFTIDVQRAHLWLTQEEAMKWIKRNRFTPFEESPLRVVVMP